MPQVVGQVPGRQVALGGPLGQGFQADTFQLPGDGLIDLPRRPGLQGGDLLEQLGARVGPEGQPANLYGDAAGTVPKSRP